MHTLQEGIFIPLKHFQAKVSHRCKANMTQPCTKPPSGNVGASLIRLWLRESNLFYNCYFIIFGHKGHGEGAGAYSCTWAKGRVHPWMSGALCGGRAPCSRVHQQCSGVLVPPPTFQVLSAPVLEPRTLHLPAQYMVKRFGHNLKINIVNSQQKVENHISDLAKGNIERVKHENSVLHPSLTCVAQFSKSETSPEMEFQVIIWLCDKLWSKLSFFYCCNFSSIMFYSLQEENTVLEQETSQRGQSTESSLWTWTGTFFCWYLWTLSRAPPAQTPGSAIWSLLVVFLSLNNKNRTWQRF